MSAIAEPVMSVEQVFIEALSLPAQSRAQLVDRLMISLIGEQGMIEIDAAWKQEICDRSKAFEEGKITESDSEEVLKRLLQKVK